MAKQWSRYLQPSSILNQIVINKNWYYPLRVFDLLFRRLHWQLIVGTSVGIKFLGKGFTSEELDEYVLGSHHYSEFGYNFGDFVINPDFLIDKFSLTGTPIAKSPHFALITAIAEGQEIEGTDYCDRLGRGILDLRKSEPIRGNIILGRYQQSLTGFNNNARVNIKVIMLERSDRLIPIIVDGKHRLAMAEYHDKYERLNISVVDAKIYTAPKFYSLYNLAHEKAEYFKINLAYLENFYGRT